MRPELEELLRRVSVGESSPDDPAVREAAAADAEFAEALRETRGLLDALERAQATRERVLEDARLRQTAPGVEGIHSMVRARMGRRRRWLQAAAGLLLALPVAWWLVRSAIDPSEPDWEETLGDRRIDGMSFEATAGGALRFTWGSSFEGGSYRVRVRDEQGLVVAESELIENTEWRVDPAAEDSIPEEAFAWEVLWYAPGGRHEFTSEAVRVTR